MIKGVCSDKRNLFFKGRNNSKDKTMNNQQETLGYYVYNIPLDPQRLLVKVTRGLIDE